MKLVFLTVFFTGLLFLNISAQVKVGNNPNTINASSVLELESTDKGLLLPRIALSNTAVATLVGGVHVAGMIVYNTATAGDVTPGYYYNNGMRWIRIIDSISSWQTTGNAGTISPTNVGAAIMGRSFLGTTDARNVGIATNGTFRAIFDQNGSLYGGTATYNSTLNPANSLVWGEGNIDSSKNSLVIGSSNVLSSGTEGGSTQTNRGTMLGGGGNRVLGISYNSIVNGSENTLTGSSFENFVAGFQNNVSSSAKMIVSGQSTNVINSSFGIASGKDCLLNNADYSFTIGLLNRLNSQYSYVLGANNNIGTSCIYGVILGQGNTIANGVANGLILGQTSSIGTNSNNSVILGLSNTIATNVTNGVAIGQGNTINSGSNYGVVLGQTNTIAANNGNTLVLGTNATSSAASQLTANFGGGYRYFVAATGNTTAATPAMVILPTSGNVGVGTATPQFNLDVFGNANDAVIIRANNSNAGANAIAQISLGNNANATGAFMLFASSTYTNLGGGNSLNIGLVPDRPITFNQGGGERLRIAPGGNVGIGTNNPTSKLQVVGLPNYATDAAAGTAGLTAGAFFRDGAGIVHVKL